MALVKQYGLTGLSGDVEFGKGGPRIVVEAGVLVTRTKAGALARSGGADPQNDNEFVTRGYLERKADIIVSGSLNGGSPPAVTNGQVLYCTATGGSYTAGELYRGESGSWVQITKFAGMKISVTIAGIGSFVADSLYLWDVEGSAWVLIGAIPATASIKKYASLDILGASTATGVNAMTTLAQNAILTKVIVDVTTIFSGSTTLLSVGFASDSTANAGAMGTAENDMHAVGTYTADCRRINPSNQALNVNYTKGTATSGQANVLVEYFIP